MWGHAVHYHFFYSLLKKKTIKKSSAAIIHAAVSIKQIYFISHNNTISNGRYNSRNRAIVRKSENL